MWPRCRSTTSAPTNRADPTTWPATFAHAEPTMPPSSANTKSGHRTADTALPISTNHSGRRVSCTPRIQPLPASVISTSGAPNSATRSHDSAATAISPPLPSAAVTGRGDELPEREQHQSHRDREPRRLHPLGDGGGPLPRAVQAGRPRGGAVREERQRAS